jgi:antitoxin component YwqK of YwqJK toxin-antitoxin module
VGYTTATQAPNGVIHIVTSKNQPDLHIELNEAWVLEGGAGAAAAFDPRDARQFRENYPSGKVRVTWSAGVASDGRYVLHGRQVFYYENGQKQWETTFQSGRRTGSETWWSDTGRKLWERTYGGDGEWIWKLFDEPGHVTAESRWKGKVLLDANDRKL